MVEARQVANQLALQKAAKAYGIKKAFTFHRSIRSAESFVASKRGEGVGYHLPTFKAFHVNGAMSAGLRDRRLLEFREAKRAIVSNARCLTEGVDLPAVDLVAFMAPKKSVIDIVQASGRAMRLSPGKKFGYVLVPLYVNAKAFRKNPTAAMEQADFGAVIKVVHALQEVDSGITEIIQAISLARGRGDVRGYNDALARLGEKVEVLGGELPLGRLEKGILLRVVKALWEPWGEVFGRLLAYRAANGDYNVPVDYPDDPKLGGWVQAQRTRYRQKLLSPDRMRRLIEVGFNWTLRIGALMPDEMLGRLRAYKDAHGNCLVPATYPDDRQLGHWVCAQRRRYISGHLSEDLTRVLADMGFEWDGRRALWEIRYRELVDYQQKHGHCNRVPKGTLRSWCVTQRKWRRNGRLDADQIARLSAIGFEWIRRLPSSPDPNTCPRGHVGAYKRDKKGMKFCAECARVKSRERTRRKTIPGYLPGSTSGSLHPGARENCPLGHPLDGVQRRSDGRVSQRYCKTCKLAAGRKRKPPKKRKRP